jgi:hypothetical protein
MEENGSTVEGLGLPFWLLMGDTERCDIGKATVF